MFFKKIIYHEKNQLDQALQDYSQAISIDSTNPIFFENRALIYLYKGEIKKAVKDYESAINVAADEKQRDLIREKISRVNLYDSKQVADEAAAKSPELSESSAR